MTFIDAISALIVFGIFIVGFSQAFLPLYNAWDTATGEYRTAQTIYFITESFRHECLKPDRNMEHWKKATSSAKELESYEITELRKGDVLVALKLRCIISQKHLEIIGMCTP